MSNTPTIPKKLPPRRLAGYSLLGAYVPRPVDAAIETWIRSGPKRNRSRFIRSATREKLIREGFLPREAGDAPAPN
jgi:hypothetical protein